MICRYLLTDISHPHGYIPWLANVKMIPLANLVKDLNTDITTGQAGGWIQFIKEESQVFLVLRVYWN